MSRVFLVPLLLCALLPLSGLAQDPPLPPLIPAPGPPSAETPAAEVSPEKPLGEIIPRPWKPERTDRRTGRIVLESLAGLLLGGIGTLPGTVIILDEALCDGCRDSGRYVLGAVLGLPGMALGGALGVKLVGSLMGGEGRFLSALAGGAVGAGLGAFVMVAVGGSGALVVPMIVLPLVGAVLGYESSHETALERRAAQGTGVTVLPTLGVPPSGGFVAGLVGSF